MEVVLLGTGSADRWPNPFCTCPSCAWARTTGQLRGRTAVLVGDRLLIDPGPDVGASGRDLSAVRTVLVTHAHPDHLDPAFLLAWTWARGHGLEVAGPPEAIRACRPWVGPTAPVTFREVSAGDEWTTGGMRVRALPAAHATSGAVGHDGTAVLYEVSADRSAGGGGWSMLHACDTAGLPHQDLAGPYDLVLLEETFGTVTAHATAHLDLASFGREVSRLRADGRLRDGGRVVAVHLSHHNPTDLTERLAALGAEVLPDGSVLRLGPSAPGRRLLLTGGARSGKSRRAEALASSRPSVTYVATAGPREDDEEWQARIAAHRSRRPGGWVLRETLEVADEVRATPAESLVLVDCLALWVTGLVDRAAAWDEPVRAAAVVDARLAELSAVLGSAPADVILVTNEVGSGVVPATGSGRLFRDLLGHANAVAAAGCDDVELVVAGLGTTLKGRTWT